MRLLLILVLNFVLLVCPCFGGVDLNGADDDYIEVTDHASFNMGTSDFSVSIWVKTSMSTFGNIVCHGDTVASNVACSGNDADEGWALRMSGAVAGAPSFYIADSDVGIIAADASTTVNDGGWHNIIITYDRNGNANIYVDGGSAEATTDISGQALSIDAGGNLTIGKRDRNTSSESPFAGSVNEFALWKGVLLTAHERSLLAKSYVKNTPLQVQPASLVLYLPLDDRNGGTGINADNYRDLSGNSNDGTGNDSDNDSFNLSEEELTYW